MRLALHSEEGGKRTDSALSNASRISSDIRFPTPLDLFGHQVEVGLGLLGCCWSIATAGKYRHIIGAKLRTAPVW